MSMPSTTLFKKYICSQVSSRHFPSASETFLASLTLGFQVGLASGWHWSNKVSAHRESATTPLCFSSNRHGDSNVVIINLRIASLSSTCLFTSSHSHSNYHIKFSTLNSFYWFIWQRMSFWLNPGNFFSFFGSVL